MLVVTFSTHSLAGTTYIVALLYSLQVQVLLESMDLGQYTSVFTKENVTGNDLAYLDDDDLENVLGICNRLHRIRLMKIISGQSSPNV